MSRVTIGNGPPRFEQPVLSGEDEQTLAEYGYEFSGVEPLRGEFVATATKTLASGLPVRAQALGATRQLAARALVRTITRP